MSMRNDAMPRCASVRASRTPMRPSALRGLAAVFAISRHGMPARAGTMGSHSVPTSRFAPT
ncbi:Uncharacterised protein [Burkholderia pseudomallei]|nr:Uncharacterised protein [Burkholderia pseudomallei]CAJ4431865.1 Uncharacterised protein [Burkholderia pseudomallei]CAJ5609656.1 Uncharacterised protein [Burkholderia pseudomallei]CAJ8862718.1 Uncharacterised protein [Burkholderia pseudomallei]CAJ8953578.1 Uncharacterised protein [Burkholderia pseudomallei]